MSVTYFFPICVMTLLGSIGAYFFKKVTDGSRHLSVLVLIKSFMMYIGGVLYVAAALINVVLLRFIDYSVLYPMTALTYIWTLIISAFLLHEKINTQKIVAIFFVCVGVILISH